MALLRTNTNRYKSNFKQVTESYLKGYGENCPETINDLLIAFNNEHNFEYNKHTIPNLQNRLSDYLQGCPYGFSFPYKHEIISFASEVHEMPIIDIPENKKDIIVENFFDHCALMMLRIADKKIVEQLY